MPLPMPTELLVSRLDTCRCHSPLHRRAEPFVDERRHVLVCSDTEELQPYLVSGQKPPAFEMVARTLRHAHPPAGRSQVAARPLWSSPA